MCERYGVPRSIDALSAGLPKDGRLDPSLALIALQNSGFSGATIRRDVRLLPPVLMPAILLRQDKGGAILLSRSDFSHKEPAGGSATAKNTGPTYQIILPESGNEAIEISHAELDQWYAGHAILVKPRAKIDTRAGEETPLPAGHWLLSVLWRYRRYYRSAALAALLINVLALASIFFSMNVYDRVVPNQAYVTLWSLAIGVILAMVFETISRQVRSNLLDVAGKKADLVTGTLLFRQALAIRMESKPASPGAFANQLREFESVRDFVTSATLSALSDLPFVFLFIGVTFAVGGPLGWVPALLVPIVIAISAAFQWPLSRAMKENLRETSLKQGVLIESVEGLETLKSVSGEGYMQRRWDTFSAMAASTSLKTRELSSLALGLIGFLQQAQTVVVIMIGVYLIGEGKLTQGALIACVMLVSRATAPLSQVAGLAVRFQQAKAAMQSLNRLMLLPIDRDPKQDYLANPLLRGQLTLKDVSFSYPGDPTKPAPAALKGISFTVEPGERVAILGKIGSGKSTLLRVMSRLYLPTQGQIFSEGIDITQLDPADWRRAVGYVGQDARLFYGTLRQNIMIGRPDASPDEFLHVLRLCGLDSVAANHPLGINLPIGETGDGLSGGQRQLVALARCLLMRPKMILLDEPTSAMDTQTESQFMKRLLEATIDQTLILVTHRISMLEAVDRIIVVDEGLIVADGPKSQVIARLVANSEAAAARPLAA